MRVNMNNETRIKGNPTEELCIMLMLHSLITMTFSAIFYPRGKCLLSMIRTLYWHPVTV